MHDIDCSYLPSTQGIEGRICESTTHLHEFFEDPVDFQGQDSGQMMYKAPVAPGYAKFHTEALTQWVWPHGSGWADESKVGAELRARADDAKEAERATARAQLKKYGGLRGWLASL